MVNLNSGSLFQVGKFCVSDGKMVDESTVVTPREVTSDDLLVVHTESYLDSLRVRMNI